MLNAKFGDFGFFEPKDYTIFSRLLADNPELTEGQDTTLRCPHILCSAEVHFYGRAAALRGILGVRRPWDVIPRFDHMDGEGENCPLKEIRHLAKKSSSHPDSSLPPPLEMTDALTIHALAVWVSMYGASNVRRSEFFKAIARASKQEVLRLHPEDAWRVPYALGIEISITASDDTKLGLVPKSLVGHLPPRHRTKEKDAFYVIHITDRSRFSGPFILNHHATNELAARGREQAFRIFNPELINDLGYVAHSAKPKPPARGKKPSSKQLKIFEHSN